MTCSPPKPLPKTPPARPVGRRWAPWLLAWAALALPVHAQAAWLAATASGQEVVDSKAALAWSRCVEGMSWTGQGCSGQPLRLSFSEAAERAAARSAAEGRAWRVPRAAELRRLSDRLAAGSSARLRRLFPDAPEGWVWTASVRIDPVAGSGDAAGSKTGAGAGASAGTSTGTSAGTSTGPDAGSRAGSGTGLAAAGAAQADAATGAPAPPLFVLQAWALYWPSGEMRDDMPRHEHLLLRLVREAPVRPAVRR